MRCKKHSSDVTSIIGVCASCLRDRLFKLIVAQKEVESVSENTKSIPPFPTSVSPYTSRRKSDSSISHNILQKPYNQRFYNSPQIAISTAGCIGGGATNSAKNRHNNIKLIKFATFQNLFRSNNNTTTTNIPMSVTSSSPSSSSSSATTRIIKNHHHQQQRCVRNRGMSPVRLSDDDDDEEEDGSSEYESIDTDTLSSCKQTPMKTIGRRGGNKSAYERVFCLSPLVRANPNRLWKGKPPVDGDVRIPKLAYTKSFCANRSRKLADFGRSDPNR